MSGTSTAVASDRIHGPAGMSTRRPGWVLLENVVKARIANVHHALSVGPLTRAPPAMRTSRRVGRQRPHVARERVSEDIQDRVSQRPGSGSEGWFSFLTDALDTPQRRDSQSRARTRPLRPEPGGWRWSHLRGRRPIVPHGHRHRARVAAPSAAEVDQGSVAAHRNRGLQGHRRPDIGLALPLVR